MVKDTHDSQQRLLKGFEEKLLRRARPLIMGVLNVTPDSFSDGGRFLSTDPDYLSKTLSAAQTLMDQGADIIDIGGESTRPGAPEVSVEDELARVLPVIQVCAQHSIPVSIDTSKAMVMRTCLAEGVVMINDVNGFQGVGVLETLSSCDTYTPYLCVMHMQGTPKTMQEAPQYDSLMNDIQAFFRQRIECLQQAGVQLRQIILDPGFGFGKTDEHNWSLLAALQNSTVNNLPLLVGLSRKSMFGRLLDRDTNERKSASIAGALIAAQRGARILRVHDIAETYDALRVLESVNEV